MSRLKIVAFPRNRGPYQELLYGPLRELGASVRYGCSATLSHTVNLSLLPLELLWCRIRGYNVFHVHWTYGFVPTGSSRSKVLRRIGRLWFGLVLRWARALGFRVVWTAHNVLPHEPVFDDDLQARRMLVNACDLVIAHGPNALEGLAAIGAKPRRSEVIPHGPIVSEQLSALPLPQPGARRTVMFFGRVAAYKGVEDLLDAVAVFGRSLNVVIAGSCSDRELRQRLITTAGKLGGNVELRLGHVPEAELGALFAAADALVFPFREVTTSGSIRLGLSSGRPIILPDLPIFDELPAGGLIRYPPGTDGLKAALAKVATMPAQTLAAMGGAARGTGASVEWPEIAGRTEAAMSALLPAHTPPAPDPGRRPRAAASPAEALRRLFGRGSVYTLALALQMSAAVLVIPVVTRLLSPSDFGRIAAGTVVLCVIEVIGAAGLCEAASRTFFSGPDGPRDARRLIVALIFTAAAVALVADLTGPLWSSLVGLHYSGLLRIAVWGGAAGSVMFGTQALLRVTERVWAFLGVTMVATIGGQGLGLALTIALGTPTGYMAGCAIGTALGAAVGLVVTRVGRDGLPSLSELRKGLRLGLPLVPHSLAVFMLVSADRLVIIAILGLAAAGRYQVAYAIGSISIALVASLNQAWMPLLLGAVESQRWEILAATSRTVHRMVAFVAGAIALGAPFALIVVAPNSYGRAGLVPVSAIVTFSVLPYVTCTTYFQAVFVKGKTRVMAIAAPIAAAANIAINIVLLPEIGLVGAAIATVAAYAILPVVVAPVAYRLVPLPGVLRDALSAWIIAVPFVVAGALLPATAVGIVLRIVGIGVALGCGAHTLRTATRSTPKPDLERGAAGEEETSTRRPRSPVLGTAP